MVVKAEYKRSVTEKVIGVADIEINNIEEFEEDLGNISYQRIFEKYGFKELSIKPIQSSIYDVKINLEEKYYALIEVDEDYNWAVQYVTTDPELILKDYENRVKEKRNKIKKEGHNYTYFDDGSELWVIDFFGDVVKGKGAYIVYGEVNGEFSVANITDDLVKAKKDLLLVVRDYTDNGYHLANFGERMFEFNNGESWRIQKVIVKKPE